ncbi:MAG: universal stress protein [Desulfobacteraceae bacterium]|nr:universal stress protein [Desulfobacteraceae bacterium]MBC2753197.1 universal stress protein [Desulfobacteraceae bacterium]
MDAQRILLPYNFSPNDQKSLAFVIRTFGPLESIDVTIFHAFTPLSEIEASDHQSATAKLKRRLSYLTQELTEREMALQEVRQYLIGKGFDKDHVRYVFKSRKGEVAAAIVEQTQEEHYDVIVLNHKPGKVTRFFTGSVFAKVVTALRDITVCIVS